MQYGSLFEGSGASRWYPWILARFGRRECEVSMDDPQSLSKGSWFPIKVEDETQSHFYWGFCDDWEKSAI